MKGAKELADMLREFCVIESEDDGAAIITHLDAKAAIDSVVPGEVGEIAKDWSGGSMLDGEFDGDDLLHAIQSAEKHIPVLLAIVQRQAGEIAALKQEHFAATLAIEQTLHDTEQRSDAARAEVERLKLEVAALRAERDHLATTRMEASAEIDRLQTERAALAQENARLTNEVGTLDATAREQRQRAEVLARGIAAYRSGSFTLAQVWENEEGKAVT